MKTPVQKALSELHQFVSEYNLAVVSSNMDLKKSVDSLFKRYYAVLLWDAHIHHSRPWPEDVTKSDLFATYITETTSDICQSLLLTVQGLYKPAYLILRSGVENFFRCMGIAFDQNVITITAVYSLIDVLKEVPFLKADPLAMRHFGLLHSEYSTLCAHVHTADIAHMAKTKVVGVFPRYLKEDSNNIIGAIARICISICSLMCIFLKRQLFAMHHTHRDVIFGVISSNTKRHITA